MDGTHVQPNIFCYKQSKLTKLLGAENLQEVEVRLKAGKVNKWNLKFFYSENCLFPSKFRMNPSCEVFMDCFILPDLIRL